MKLDSKLIKYFKYFYEISDDKNLPNNFCGFWFLMVIALLLYPIIIVLTFPHTVIGFFSGEIGYKDRYDKGRNVSNELISSLMILVILFLSGGVLTVVIIFYYIAFVKMGILLEGTIFLVFCFGYIIITKLFGSKIEKFMDKNYKKMDYE